MGGTIKYAIDFFEMNDSETMHPDLEFRKIPHIKLNRQEELSTNFWFNNAKDFVTKQLNQSTSPGFAFKNG